MAARKTTPKDTFMDALETAVKAVIANAEATPAEIIKAIEAGTKLSLIRHRIDGDADDDDNFFGGKRK